MFLAITAPGSDRVISVEAASYSTDSAGTLHAYRLREFINLIGGTVTESVEFLTVPAYAYEMVVSGNTPEELADRTGEISAGVETKPGRKVPGVMIDGKPAEFGVNVFPSDENPGQEKIVAADLSVGTIIKCGEFVFLKERDDEWYIPGDAEVRTDAGMQERIDNRETTVLYRP